MYDTAELVIQFGYTVLFISALPVTALFNLVSNLVEMQGDAWRLLVVSQRPVPAICEDIGVWQQIFTIISIGAIVSNSALSVFTMDVINKYNADGTETRHGFWLFTLFQWCGFLFAVIIIKAIPDVAEEVEIQLKRTEFFRKRLEELFPARYGWSGSGEDELNPLANASQMGLELNRAARRITPNPSDYGTNDYRTSAETDNSEYTPLL